MSAADARAALEEAAQHQRNGHDYDAGQAIARAQVHATLALVEEQRTANLIALFDEEAPEVFGEVRSNDPEERKRGVHRIRARWLVLAAEIAERLDLA